MTVSASGFDLTPLTDAEKQQRALTRARTAAHNLSAEVEGLERALVGGMVEQAVAASRQMHVRGEQLLEAQNTVRHLEAELPEHSIVQGEVARLQGSSAHLSPARAGEPHVRAEADVDA